MTFFLWFFSTFVEIIFSFVMTEFLIAACCFCRDIKLLCHNIVLLSSTVESKLYVTTDFENVATCFLPWSLSLAELFVATLKSLSQPTGLDLSHCSSIFCRHTIFFYRSRYLSLYSSLCRDINLIIEKKNSTAICLIIVATEQNNIATSFFKNFSINVVTQKSIVATKFCLLITIMSQHSFLCHNIYHSIPLILCRDKVVKCRNILHF